MAEGVLLYGMNPARRRQEVVQRFVNDVLADGKSRGRAMQVSTLPPSLYRHLKKMGIVKTDHIFLPDNTILKYRNHEKSKKGAPLPYSEFWKVVNISNSPSAAYIDTHRNTLVFALTSRHHKGKVIKIIIEPNYNFKGRIANVITSIGVVQRVNMKQKKNDGSIMYQKLK